ncbi:Activating transcription factor 7-interacting protein 1 [Halocaridina rubra]|uniref:Activating transcription factor 7-interacting protein 1 n=1 Tax=Halocaridina rubra TaxID=373956 RepID=A0AAN8WVR3_HALRR
MKAMDPGAPMISVPAGVIKELLNKSNTPSPTPASKSNTPTPPPPKRTPSPELGNTPGSDSSLPTERSNSEKHTNGEKENGDEVDSIINLEDNKNSKENKENSFILNTSVNENVDVPITNGNKRQIEDLDPKQDLKKVRYFGEDRNKNAEKEEEETKKIETNSLEDNDEIKMLSSSITLVKSDEKKLGEADVANTNATNKHSGMEMDTDTSSPIKAKSEYETDVKTKTDFDIVKPKKDYVPVNDVKKSSASPVTLDLEVIEDETIISEKTKLMNKVKKLSRKDLQKLIMNLFSEKILYQFELGRQKVLTEKLENTLEANRKKTVQFHKEIEDLRKVTNRLALEQASRKGQYVAPIKIKRSVGIQAAPHIINKGLQNAQGTSSTVKTIAPRTMNSGRFLNVAQNAGFHSKPLHTSGSVSVPSQQPGGRSTLGTSQTLVNTTVGALSHPAGTIGTTRSGQSLIMTQSAPGQMQAVPRPTTAGRTTIARPAGNMPAPGTLVRVPVTGAQLLAIPQSGGLVLLPNNGTAATLVVSQVSGVQTVNSPVVAQARTQTVTTTPRVTGNSFRPIPAATMASSQGQPKHPAPLPKTQAQQVAGTTKKLPPQPSLRLSHKDNSIVLSWTMAKTEDHETIASYQLYAYQEGSAPPCWTLWKKVGSVKALELPMACTLTQFMPGHVYHFAVRAVDIKSRLGPFSEPRSITLEKK